MIPNEFINDLLNRIDIVDVVGRYVQLKKAGANHQGLCPFHNEKSPSFTVSPAKQFYHCFGCGAHGTALGFLMEHNGMTFVEAIQDLARQAGMTVPQDKPMSPQQMAQQREQRIRSESMGQVLSEANTHYQKQLREHPHAIAYLKRRGLTGEIALKFGLGYAPFETSLHSIFQDYQDSSALIESGLCKQRDAENGKPARRYDFFRDRIMFPIRNTKGQIIGFGGRILDKGEPKYLNSPETSLFQKGLELYGLFEARPAISQHQYALVVEGYMDVVALAQAGLENAVATLGTATSSAHVQKLFRFTDTIVFSFDGDSAGRKAAWRAMLNALPHATDTRTIKFLFLPPEHDPDTFVREKGVEAFSAEVSTAMTLSQFILYGLNQAAPDATPEARARQFHLAKPIFQGLPNSALRTQIMRAFADQVKATVNDVMEYCELTPNNRARKAPRDTGKRTAPPSVIERAVDLVLWHAELALTAQVDVWSTSPQHQPLTDLIALIQQQPDLNQAAFHHQIEQTSHAPLYHHILEKHLRDSNAIALEDAQLAFSALEKQVQRHDIDLRLQHLAQQVNHNPEAKAQYMALLRTRNSL